MTAKEKILSVTVMIAILAVIYDGHRVTVSRAFTQSLQQQQAQLQKQIEDLASERDRLNGELAALREKNRKMAVGLPGAPDADAAALQLQPSSEESGRVSTPRADDETSALASSWADAARLLKERFEQTPSAKIPEMQLLDSADWLNAARTAKLDSDFGYHKAMAEMRKRAEELFTKKFQAALDLYMTGNDGRWPPSLDELTRYFFPPVDETILHRWQILPSTSFPGRSFAGDWVLTEKSPVDPDFDFQWTIDGPSSSGVGPYSHGQSKASSTTLELQALRETLDPTIQAYKAANGGREPNDPYQLRPFSTGAAQATALDRLIQINTTNH